MIGMKIISDDGLKEEFLASWCGQNKLWKNRGYS